jgi:uncharacterized repeat protein (TIGR01451 family)
MPRISSDGRYVAFLSTAENLVAGDDNGETDVFVHDRNTGTTERVNLSSNNGQTNGPSYGFPSISADGRFVVFTSTADNLVSDDTNGVEDVFLRDRITSETIRLSECPCDNEQGNNISRGPAISADGNFVAFESAASNLLIGLADTNHGYDVFVYEQQNIEPVADLFVMKTDSQDPVGVDEEVIYTITVSNLGPDNATGVELRDQLPFGSNVNFISASADQGDCQESAGMVTCTLGDIAAGSNVTAAIVVSYPVKTIYTNTVIVEGNEIDPDNTNNSASEDTTIVTSTSQPDISVSPMTIDFGDTTTTRMITISNIGGGTLNWNISQVLPEWLSVFPVSGDTSGGPSTVEVVVHRDKAEGFGIHNTNLKLMSDGGNKDIFIQMEKITIANVILILKIIAGMDSNQVVYEILVDVNEDGKIGLPEAIYILQKISGLKP